MAVIKCSWRSFICGVALGFVLSALCLNLDQQTLGANLAKPGYSTIGVAAGDGSDGVHGGTRSYNASMRLPTLQLAGIQKGGTSSIAHYLFANNYACRSHDNKVKESHFFDQIDTFAKGIEHYKDMFRKCNQMMSDDPHMLRMDATPNYELHPERVYEAYKAEGSQHQVKIIFSLREPVAREISWFRHRERTITDMEEAWPGLNDSMMDKDGKKKSFETVMEETVLKDFETGDYRFSYAMYAFHLKKWFNLFDRKNILVLSYDEVTANQSSVLERIHKFLEIPIAAPLQLKVVNANQRLQSHPEAPPCGIQNRLAGAFEKPNNDLYALLEANPGPDMEQRPFPPFKFSCKD